MKKTAIILLAATFLVAGCGQKGGDTGKVLKTVGKEKITEADVKKEIDNLPAQYKSFYDNEDGKKKIIERLAEQKILKQVAVKQGLERDKDFVKDLEVTKERLLANYAVKKNVIEKVKATDEEIKKEYEAKKDTFKQAEQVSASHILIRANAQMSKEDKAKAQAKAEAILKDALAGKDFAELAKTNSEDGSAQNGGSLGWFEKGKMVKSFEDAAFAAEKGKVYPKIVETQFGYHIIKVDDKKAEGYKTIDDVKNELKEEIENKKRIDEFNKWMDGLKKEYKF